MSKLGLRDYQVRTHDAVLRGWGHPEHVMLEALPEDAERLPPARSLMANLATSAGKTICAAYIAKTITEQLNGRVLFVADREELITQPVAKFHQACGIISGVHRAAEKAPAAANVVIASIQTLSRRLPVGRPFTHIIDDEAHRNTEARAKIHAAYPEAKILGITATAMRKGLADLSQWYERVAMELGTFDLVDEGYITPPKILTIPLKIDLTSVHQRNGDYDLDEVDAKMEPHYRAFAKAIKEYAPNRTILAFLPLIRSSQAFVNILLDEGISAMHCDGSTADRKEIIQRFERGEFQVLSNSQVFSTGVDFIRCDCLLNLSPTRSRVEFRQRAGRIMRLLPGVIDPGGVTLPTKEERKAAIAASAKPDCLILDLLWQTKSIGLAGPASLIAMNEEDEDAIAEKMKKKRTPEEIEAIAKEVQADREERLRKELEKAQKEKERLEGEAARRATLIDARSMILELHDRDLLNYEPVTKWESGAITAAQKKLCVKIGVDEASLKNAGVASKFFDIVLNRQARGLAPVEAFRALKLRGVAKPAEATLNDAIRVLGHDFPNLFGTKFRGKTLRETPRWFYNWMLNQANEEVRTQCKRTAPATWRYATKVVFPEYAGTPVQEALPI